MLEAIFAPQSVAIVGASPAPCKPGYHVLRNAVENDYAGRAFPTHTIWTVLPDTPALPSIHAFPELNYSKMCLLDAAQGDGHGNSLRRLD